MYEDDEGLVHKESEALFSCKKTRGVNINRNYRKDGSVIWCQWYSSAIFDASGGLTSVLSLVLDVTEYRKSREQLDRLASFPALNPNPVLEADPSGKILYMNAATSSELPEVSRLGDVSPFQLNWDGIISQVKSGTNKSQMRDVEVNGVWYSLSIHKIPNSDNVHIYVTNIDERKKGEQALADTNEELAAANDELAA